MPVYHSKIKTKPYYFSVSINGKRYVRRGFKTRKEALLAESDFIVSGKYKSLRMPSFKGLVNAYLAFKKDQIKISTFYSLNLNIKNHFETYFDSFLDISLIDSHAFDQWWSNIKKSNTVSRANRFLNILIELFDFASNKYGYSDNSYKILKKAKDYSIHHAVEKKEFLTLEDLKKFLTAVDYSYWKTFYVLLFFTGMRISEIRGLQLAGYHNGKLEVYQQAFSKAGKNKFVLISTKTDSSSRMYFLPESLQRMLNEHIQRFKLKSPKDFLFPSANSKKAPIGETTARRALDFYIKKSGVSPFSFHKFRHSDATLLHEMGLTPEVIASYLGHSEKAITEKVYIHESNENKEHIANMLDKVVSNLVSTKNEETRDK